MKEIFKNITKKEVHDIEKNAELQEKLAYDNDHEKYEGKEITTKPSTPWTKPEPTDSDIENAQKMHDEGHIELIENNIERRDDLDKLHQKYQKQKEEFDNLNSLLQNILNLEKQEIHIKDELEKCHDQLDALHDELHHDDWQQYVSFDDVYDAIQKSPIDARMLELQKKKDLLLKMISLGFAHPKNVGNLLTAKAMELIEKKKRYTIEKKIKELIHNLMHTRTGRSETQKEIDTILSYKNSPDWEEFSSLEDREKELAILEKDANEFETRHHLN